MLLIWAFAVGAGILATGPLFGRLADSRLPKSVESVVASDVIAQGNDSAGTVIAVVDEIDPADARVRAAVLAAAMRLLAIDGVKSALSPYGQATLPAGMISSDGRAVVVSVVLTALDQSARDRAASATVDALHRLRDDLPAGPSVEVGGAPVLRLQNRTAVKQDLSRAEIVSLPATLLASS